MEAKNQAELSDRFAPVLNVFECVFTRSFRIYKDVRPTGNSWTVFLQATSAQPLTRQIHRRNARQIRLLSQFPRPSESQGLPSETQGS